MGARLAELAVPADLAPATAAVRPDLQKLCFDLIDIFQLRF